MNTIVLAALLALGAAPGDGKKAEARVTSFFQLEARGLDGTPRKLSEHAGKVVLVVNTASECGYTPQYAGLERLHQELGPKGLVVLGFPSNEFGGQEPGDATAIRKFCTLRYGVTFPLFEKVRTKGDDAHPVYAFLGAKHGAPAWNFHKYLVGKDGAVLQAFSSRVAPDDAALRDAIVAALGR
jgi:glutathione peroxidase